MFRIILLFTLLLGTATTAADNSNVHDPAAITATGVYLKTDEGYARMAPYRHARFDFNFFNSIPVANDVQRPVELIVYIPGVGVGDLEFENRTIEIPGARAFVEPVIEPLGENRLRVTFDQELEMEGFIIAHVFHQCCHNSPRAIALTAPEPALLELYAEGQDLNATTIAHNVEKALDAYPENEQMQQLLGYWQNREYQARVQYVYDFMDEAWQDYQAASGLTAKQQALRNVRARATGYLERHPDGEHADTVQERLAYAERELGE
ncbi:MAG: hypothetical protein JJU06_21680 [Ectothiorhodospiraceae bacterium]|nr:hypothetical protein [Ectothiorhodospiraceae bacterium]